MIRTLLRQADEWLELILEWATDCTDLALASLSDLRAEIAALIGKQPDRPLFPPQDEALGAPDGYDFAGP